MSNNHGILVPGRSWTLHSARPAATLMAALTGIRAAQCGDFSPSAGPNPVNRCARISDNKTCWQDAERPSEAFPRRAWEREAREVKQTLETTFGKLIPTEGPTFPGWLESSTARAVARQIPPISQRL